MAAACALTFVLRQERERALMAVMRDDLEEYLAYLGSGGPWPPPVPRQLMGMAASGGAAVGHSRRATLQVPPRPRSRTGL